MKIANADKLIQHFESCVDVKLFTVPEIVTIINSFSLDIPEEAQIVMPRHLGRQMVYKQLEKYKELGIIFEKQKPGIDNKLLSEEHNSEVLRKDFKEGRT